MKRQQKMSPHPSATTAEMYSAVPVGFKGIENISWL